MVKPSAEMLQAIAAERPYLLRLASRRLPNAELSEDVVQATLAAAVANAGSFRQKSSMRTWLTAILRNSIVDVQRARRREPLLDDLPRGAASRDAPATAPDPADIMQALQAAGALRARLQALPKAAVAAFTMRELQGRPSKEILERLRLTPSQYWQALHRARRAIRSAIENPEATLC